MLYRIARICQTPAECAQGLMNTMVADDECCVFIPSNRIKAFWGHDTPQDLAVVSVCGDKVACVGHIKAYDETPVAVPPADAYIEVADKGFPYDRIIQHDGYLEAL